MDWSGWTLLVLALGGLLALWGITLRRVVKQRTEQLQVERTHLRALVQTIPDLIWLKDPNGVFLSCNPCFERLFGVKEALILGKTDYDFFDRDVADTFRAYDLRAIEAGKACINEEWITFVDDQYRGLFETIKTPVYDAEGALIGVLGVARDITEHHQTEEKLRASERFFQTLALVNPVGIFRTDAGGSCEFVNQRWCEMAGLTESQALGDGWVQGLYLDDRERVREEWEVSAREHRPFSLEYRFQQPCGDVVWVYGQSVATRDEAGEVTGYVGTVTDITQRKHSEDEIRHLAFYDALTHLPNRRLLQERLQQAITAHARSERHGALLFIDLDNFKTLNDTSGHDKGDQLLQDAARLLVTCVRDADTVARLGGDEFVVILESLSEQPQEAAAQTEAIAEKILVALNRSYPFDEHEHHGTASIGITLFGREPLPADELLKQADLAMYRAKTAGRNALRFFDPEMQAVVTARAALETDIRKGLQEGQFLLYYQPQVDAQGRPTGVEALVRWQHPQRGMVSPAAFIPLAEETGLIVPLGCWVIETACHQAAAWARDPLMRHLTLAVNVSARQFRQPGFVDDVRDILRSAGVQPGCLKLELTESLLLEDVQDIIAKMSALKAEGVGFSLDDFGTGYSSLSYLKRLPLDQLKIDQGFVRDVLSDPDDAVIARTIISLGRSLGLDVIAEGVETEAQRAFLFAEGCHAYQGYLYSRPLPLQALQDFLRERLAA